MVSVLFCFIRSALSPFCVTDKHISNPTIWGVFVYSCECVFTYVLLFTSTITMGTDWISQQLWIFTTIFCSGIYELLYRAREGSYLFVLPRRQGQCDITKTYTNIYFHKHPPHQLVLLEQRQILHTLFSPDQVSTSLCSLRWHPNYSTGCLIKVEDNTLLRRFGGGGMGHRGKLWRGHLSHSALLFESLGPTSGVCKQEQRLAFLHPKVSSLPGDEEEGTHDNTILSQSVSKKDLHPSTVLVWIWCPFPKT